MRVTTAFNRLPALQGAGVIDVLFAADGVMVRIAFAPPAGGLLGVADRSAAGCTTGRLGHPFATGQPHPHVGKRPM